MAQKSVSKSERVHVVSRGGSWAVKREGATRASGVYDTKDEAVSHAKKIGSNQKADVVVHKRDGTISKWHKSK